MLVWLKHNARLLITVLVTAALCVWLYACESKTKSLVEPTRLVNRAELQFELDQFMSMAQLRMLDLDRQDAFRSIIIKNSLLVMQGTPFNPVGLITAIAGIYGLAHAATKTTKAIVKVKEKLKVSNG